MNLPLHIAWRYLRRPGDRLITAGGTASILGLVIGVMALVISMALMTGYRRDLERKLLGGNAEIYLSSIAEGFDQDSETLDTVANIPGVEQVRPTILQQSIVTSQRHAGAEQVMLKGIDISRADLPPMIRNVVGEDLQQTESGRASAAVGTWLAEKLGVRVGDLVTVTVPSDRSGSFLPRSEIFIVRRVFESGFHEFDSAWIFVPLEEARELVGRPGAINVIEVDVGEGWSIGEVMASIDLATGSRFALTDWRASNRQLFSLLAIQQLVLFIVIGLIVFVSTFNIVSTLIMTIQEKRKEIGILMSMGGERRMIRRIFICYGTLVGAMGTATGLLLGVVVSFVITRYELISFGPEIAQVYFVSSIPFITTPVDLTLIGAFAMIVCWLATLIPSNRAAKLQPVDSIRYE